VEQLENEAGSDLGVVQSVCQTDCRTDSLAGGIAGGLTKSGARKPVKARTALGAGRRVLFAALGFIFFGLGAVGAFLPILPTTPFLLLAAACFSRSSQRFDDWIKGTKLYKKHLESFVSDRSMPLKTKVSICALASTMMIIALVLANNLYVRIFIAALIVFLYYYFIFRIRTAR
jgi:uncharacterized membrane protein YbaN (DUF454 family)